METADAIRSLSLIKQVGIFGVDRTAAIKEAIKALRFKEYIETLYGQGLEVKNWHHNGTTEPLDTFIEAAHEAEKSEG